MEDTQATHAININCLRTASLLALVLKEKTEPRMQWNKQNGQSVNLQSHQILTLLLSGWSCKGLETQEIFCRLKE